MQATCSSSLCTAEARVQPAEFCCMGMRVTAAIEMCGPWIPQTTYMVLYVELSGTGFFAYRMKMAAIFSVLCKVGAAPALLTSCHHDP